MPFILLKFKNDKEEQELMLLLEDTWINKEIWT